MAIDKDLLDQLLSGREARDLFGRGGLLDDLKKALSERILSTELDDHLAQEEAAGVQPDIRPITLDGTGQEGVHALVDLAAQARDLAFANPLHPHGFDQVIDRTG